MEENTYIKASAAHDQYSFGATVLQAFRGRAKDEGLRQLALRALIKAPSQRISLREAALLLKPKERGEATPVPTTNAKTESQ